MEKEEQVFFFYLFYNCILAACSKHIHVYFHRRKSVPRFEFYFHATCKKIDKELMI